MGRARRPTGRRRSRSSRRPARILAMVTKPDLRPEPRSPCTTAPRSAPPTTRSLADPSDPLFNRAIARRPEPARLDVQARRRGGGARVRASTPPSRRSRTRRRSRCPARDAVVRNAERRHVRRRRRGDARRRAAALAATSRSPSSACELGDDRDPRAGREVRVQPRVRDPDRDRAEHLPARARRARRPR